MGSRIPRSGHDAVKPDRPSEFVKDAPERVQDSWDRPRVRRSSQYSEAPKQCTRKGNRRSVVHRMHWLYTSITCSRRAAVHASTRFARCRVTTSHGSAWPSHTMSSWPAANSDLRRRCCQGVRLPSRINRWRPAFAATAYVSGRNRCRRCPQGAEQPQASRPCPRVRHRCEIATGVEAAGIHSSRSVGLGLPRVQPQSPARHESGGQPASCAPCPADRPQSCSTCHSVNRRPIAINASTTRATNSHAESSWPVAGARR